MGFDNHSKTIIVTGATGFIGSRLARALAGQGHKVYGLTRKHEKDFFSSMDSGLRRNDDMLVEGIIKTVHGDFGDAPRMSEILNEIKPDIIIHAAGVTPHNAADNEMFQQGNVIDTKILLDSVASMNQDIAFINLSTIGVYGAPSNPSGIVSENDICHPASPYAQSKYDFEQSLKAQNDVPYLNLRVANIPGRDAFINYVVDNKKVGFHGDVPYIRDYIHLDDLCALVAQGVDYLCDGGESLTLNAGSGVGYSFPDIVTEIETQMGINVEKQTAPAKSGDVIAITCNITRARQRLKWEPQQTDLKDIIAYALQNRQL